MTEITATIVTRAWRKIDIKLNIDGEMHVLRWRRGLFADEVLFDDRRVASSAGLFNRDTIYGLGVKTETETEIRLLLSIDTADSWNDWANVDYGWEMRPRGVRLETADEALIAYGSLGPDRAEPFRQLFDRAVKSLGLS